MPIPSRRRPQILDEIGKAKYTIQRSKGLGENEPDMMWLTTMNPETRRLIKVSPAEAEATAADVRPAAGGQPGGTQGVYRRRMDIAIWTIADLS